MVEGRLLTHHPGGVHGGGEGPGGDPPLRQGAGKSSPGAPDLGSAAAAKQRCDCGKGFPVPRVSRRALNIRQRVASEGLRGAQAAPRHGLGGGGPPGRLGAWWPPPAELRGSGRFRNADFLYIFSGIFLTVFVMEKPEIQKQQKTETGTGVH